MRLPYRIPHQSFTSWTQGPSTPVFPADHVDVWLVQLEEPVQAFSPDVLSSEELARASRFHFDKDRLHFTRCRSALRLLLSRYLEIPASAIHFEYQASGKPELTEQQNRRGLHFNVSHSGGLALVAVNAGHRVGIDIEKVRHDVDVPTLAERFFSARERAGLRALPEDLRVPGFFACWTRKESFLKATGDGLSFPLAEFSVTTHPDVDPGLEELRGDTEAGNEWFLADLKVCDGYRAAVAVDGTPSRLETYSHVYTF